MESKKRLMVVLDLDENNNAEVVFTKELIQNREDFEGCEGGSTKIWYYSDLKLLSGHKSSQL